MHLKSISSRRSPAVKLSRTLTPRAVRRAFTLMEVLIVVAIIVVLAGLATVSFKYLSESSEKAALAKMKNIEAAVTAYRTSHSGQLPPNIETLTDTSETGTAYLDLEAIKDPWEQEFQLTGVVNR